MAVQAGILGHQRCCRRFQPWEHYSLTPPLVEWLGWPGFFVVTVFIALPGLWLLHLRRHEIRALDSDRT